MEHKDYLWYIIPGALFLFPLIIKKGEPLINVGNLQIITFLMLVFVTGYIIHQTYRIVYRYVFFTHRPLIKFLIHKLQQIDIEVCGTEADYLYSYFIYADKDYSSWVSLIRNKFQVSSSIFSCMMGAIFGLILNFFYVKNTLFYYIYGFIIIVLGLNYYLVFWKWMSGEEKVLVAVNFDEKFKSRKTEIMKILEEIK